MNTEIKSGKKISIRNIGKDELWLQSVIYEIPSILGLGDLEPMAKERTQSSGGRLDIMLKSQDNEKMYEVEVMLGETDPSHIIRTIEYWDIEKRRYPKRQHFPVLIAESFNARYFNVIQLLSLNIPMIAIQADLLAVEDQHVINFTKVLDVYEEPDELNSTESTSSENSWAKASKWTLSASKELLSLFESQGQSMSLNYTKYYISLVKNRANAYWLYKRTEPKSYLGFKERDEEKVLAIKKLFEASSIYLKYNSYQEFYLEIDSEFIKKHKELLGKLNEIRFKGKVLLDENQISN